jgi:MYND finger
VLQTGEANMAGTATASSTDIEGLEEEPPYEPASGSWVAELEEARLELAAATATATALTAARQQRSQGDDADGAANDEERGGGNVEVALQAHLRVCRAHAMLRQWDRLHASSKKGLALLKSADAASPSGSASAASRTEAALREHRKRARAELSVDSMLATKGGVAKICLAMRVKLDLDESDSDPKEVASLDIQSRLHREAIKSCWCFPNKVKMAGSIYANTNLFQEAVLSGDLRLMEFMVAFGAALDDSFKMFRGVVTRRKSIIIPCEASALLMACVILAIADSTGDRWAYARRIVSRSPETLDRIAECAMQLVRLGADVSRTLDLSDPPYEGVFRIREMDGKSAFQIAAMSKRRALVALMWEHMNLLLDDRAAIVHCRCGSRLPWKRCHSTGVGQPPHYISHSDRNSYRVSPLARCPCEVVPKTYYKCCWKDNSAPTYLRDSSGIGCKSASDVVDPRFLRMDLTDPNDPARAELWKECKRLSDLRLELNRPFRESPTAFQQTCCAAGPKTRMTAWNWQVYAGCLERMQRPHPWIDVHWHLDRVELLRQAHEWNAALQRYCDDMGLQGDERQHVVAKHTANPCGPCGFLGCDAFETKVRDFQRCSQCKAIAYCGRRCQKKDWAEHQKVCNVRTDQGLRPATVSQEHAGNHPSV